MTRTIVSTGVFERLWKSLGLNEENLRQLENYLLAHPGSGAVIQGTGGLRKLRWRKPGTGKSGGIRVLYVDFPAFGFLYLITLIDKSEQETISPGEKAGIRQIIAVIEASLSG